MNRKLLFVFPLFLLTTLAVQSQFAENFNDGNFTAAPVWIGEEGDWIVNPAGQLQSNSMVSNSVFYLSTASTLSTGAGWQFYADLAFATSGTNYADVYLTASASDITAITTSGYFVRIGNTADEISLYRKDAGVATPVKIIDGADGSVNSSVNNRVKIKVIRDAANRWTLLRDMTGLGNTYFNEGNVKDSTYTTSAYFGILIKQSAAASFGQKHFFDDIAITPYVPDTAAPAMLSATAVTANRLDVLFNEPLDNMSAQTLANYMVNNLVGLPGTAILDSTDKALVHLTFVNNFPGGISCTLTVNNMQDVAGNIATSVTTAFTYFAPYAVQQYDVVIDEIMADPTPVVTLPDNEWIELKNTTAHAINLQGWKLNNQSGSGGKMPAFILQPGSFVIACSGNTLAAMAPFGAAVAVTGFPSLTNDAGQLSLVSPQGKIIHAVNYSANWYQDELKKNGGWTLEMIDTKNPCAGISNWKASTDIRGGTPGIKNAVDGINTDNTPPALLRASAPDSINMTLVFSEPLDSLTASTITNYSISDGIGIPVSAIALPPFFNRVNLKLNVALSPQKVYTLSATGITDCTGNVIGSKHTARLGLSAVADSQDIVINEILYNPPSNGSDYVELYNRSNKIIDLQQTYIANRAGNGTISTRTQVSADSYLLFPQDFVVLTNEVAFVKAAYITLNPDGFIAVKLPAYNNDKGSVVILNTLGNIIDEVDYNDGWQFKLLANTEGVSLEKIDYNGPGQLAGNWHSAATSVGYGTPGYKNSQYRTDGEVKGNITITPAIVSPDNDGRDDFATISYNFPEPGYVTNITIFDASGRPVRYLQRNALCGTAGNFRWDGLGEKSQALPTGIYIIYTEIFNLDGKTQKFKDPIVLARRN